MSQNWDCLPPWKKFLRRLSCTRKLRGRSSPMRWRLVARLALISFQAKGYLALIVGRAWARYLEKRTTHVKYTAWWDRVGIAEKSTNPWTENSSQPKRWRVETIWTSRWGAKNLARMYLTRATIQLSRVIFWSSRINKVQPKSQYLVRPKNQMWCGQWLIIREFLVWWEIKTFLRL